MSENVNEREEVNQPKDEEKEEEKEKEKDEDEEDFDDDDDEKKDGDEAEGEGEGSGKFKLLDPLLKPIKKEMNSAKKKAGNFVRGTQAVLTLGAFFLIYLSYDFITEDLIPKFQGQDEVVVVETKIINNGECYYVRVDSGYEFCVKQRDYPFYNVGETHYTAEVDGFIRLEVKKDEIRDHVR